MTIKAVKLLSGEELIGEAIDESAETITLQNILAIMLQRTQDGNIGVSFVPFAPYLGKNCPIEFKHDNIFFAKEVDDQMRNQYNSIFGGVVVPPKQILMG